MTLIKYGVDPFQRAPGSNWTVLHYVIFYGVVDTFLALFPEFEKVAGIEMPDFMAWTLLHLAIGNGDRTIIRHLLASGSDWKAETFPSYDEGVPFSVQGKPTNPIQLAVAYGDERYLALLDILDELGLLQGSGDEECVWFDAPEMQI